jgi:hypothetical protein
MREVKQTVVIMSASKSGLSDSTNAARKQYLQSALQIAKDCGFIRFSHALGFYKGEAEHSFVIVIERDHNRVLKSMLMLANDYEQESVLVRDDAGVYLHYMQYFPQPYRQPERIGRDLFRVKFEGPNRPDAYTYVNGLTWVAA